MNYCQEFRNIIIIILCLLINNYFQFINAIECPSNYISNDEATKCFYMTKKEYKMTKCESVCNKQANSSLVSITSQQEQDFITNYFFGEEKTLAISSSVWMGLFYANVNNTLKWVWSSDDTPPPPPKTIDLKFGSIPSMTILEKDKRGEIDVKREYRERFYNYTNWKKDFIPTDWDCISPCSGLHTLDDEYEGKWKNLDCSSEHRCLCQYPSYHTDFYSRSSTYRLDHSDGYPLQLLCFAGNAGIFGVFASAFGCIVFLCLGSCYSFTYWLPRPKKNGLTDMTLVHCPNSAKENSILEFFSPNSGKLINVIVPKDVRGGQYFQMIDNNKHNNILINDPNTRLIPELLASFKVNKLTPKDKRAEKKRKYYESKEKKKKLQDNSNVDNANKDGIDGIDGIEEPKKFSCDCMSKCCYMPVEEGESGVYCCCFPSDPHQALILHAPTKNPNISKEYNKRVNTVAFTALRGFGSLQVVIGHFFNYYARNSKGSEFGGANAVFLFFVMSGFLMMVGYAGKGEKDTKQSNLFFLPSSSNFSKRFVINRFARIFPIYWCSVLLTIPLNVIDFYNQGSFYNFCNGSVFKAVYVYIFTSLFFQTWVRLNFINVPLWSICSQFFCYTLFPIIMGPFHSVRNTIRFLYEITLFWQLYAAGFILLLYTVSYITAHCYPTQSLPLFLIGCIFGSQALTNLSVVKTDKYIKQWSYINNSLTLLITLIWVTQISLSFIFEGAGITSRIFGEVFLPPMYGIWLYSFTQAPDSLSSVIFNMDIFQTIGNYSFSIYCFHFPIMQYYALFRFGAAEVAKYNLFVPYTERDDDGFENNVKLNPIEIIPILIIIFIISSFSYYNLETISRKFLSTYLMNIFCNDAKILPRKDSQELVSILKKPKVYEMVYDLALVDCGNDKEDGVVIGTNALEIDNVVEQKGEECKMSFKE